MPVIPKCKCDQPCLSKEAFKSESRGRWYWVCRTKTCRFFTWDDPGPHVYTPIIHKPIETNNNDSTSITSKFNVIQHKREQVPFTITDADCPLVARESRIARPKKRRTLNNTKTNIQLSLYTTTDICIRAEGKHSYIQSLLNTLSCIAWVEQKHMWVFPAAKETYIPVWNLMKQHRATFEVSGVPSAVLRLLPDTKEQLLATALQPQHEEENNSMDWLGTWFQQRVITTSVLWKSMTMNQRIGMKKGVKLTGNVYLEDTIGSGQSLQALGIALVHQDKWPVLIVCPTSTLVVWKNLIKKMLSMESHDVCLLDPLPFLKTKTGYSTKPKAVKSRIYRQKRKLLLQQQEDDRQHRLNGIPSSASSLTISSMPSTSTLISSSSISTTSSPLSPLSPKDTIHEEINNLNWFVSLKNDSGDPVKAKKKRKDSSTLQISTHHPSSMNTLDQKRFYDEPNFYIDMANTSDVAPNIDKEFDHSIGLSWNKDNADHLDDSDDDDDDDTDEDNLQDTTTNTGYMNTGDCMDGSTGDPNDEQGEIYNQRILNTAHFCIVSYDKAKTRLRALAAKNFKLVIFDECHDIRNAIIPTYASALQRLVNAAEKTIMVSGISVLDKPMQSYPLLRVLKPNLFVDYQYFGHRYCGAKQYVFGWDYTGKSNSEELQFLLERTVLVH